MVGGYGIVRDERDKRAKRTMHYWSCHIIGKAWRCFVAGRVWGCLIVGKAWSCLLVAIAVQGDHQWDVDIDLLVDSERVVRGDLREYPFCFQILL